MEKVTIETVERSVDCADVLRRLSGPLGAEGFALNYYELDPGSSFAYGYHAHDEQEEVFYVQSGRVTFETEDGDVPVAAGDIVRFAPGEYQQGVNAGDERVVALALGVPAESGGSHLLCDCPDCGGRTDHTIELVDDGAAKITRCLDCGAETARYTL